MAIIKIHGGFYLIVFDLITNYNIIQSCRLWSYWSLVVHMVWYLRLSCIFFLGDLGVGVVAERGDQDHMEGGEDPDIKFKAFLHMYISLVLICYFFLVNLVLCSRITTTPANLILLFLSHQKINKNSLAII